MTSVSCNRQVRVPRCHRVAIARHISTRHLSGFPLGVLVACLWGCERKVNAHKGAARKRKLLLPGGTVLWRLGDKSVLSPLAGVAPDLNLLS